MKTLRIIGTGLFAILLCVCVAACNGDDDEESGIGEQPPTENPSEEGSTGDDSSDEGTSGGGQDDVEAKKLVNVTLKDEEGYIQYIDFSYDAYGRLSNCHDVGYLGSDLEHEYTYEYLWSEGEVIERYADGETIAGYALDNGLISELYKWGQRDVLSYNSSNQLVGYVESADGDKIEYNYSWSGDKVTKMTTLQESEGFHFVSALTYLDRKCSVITPIAGIFLTKQDHALFWVHPEIIGIKTNYVPSGFETKFADGTFVGKGTFEYEFDAEGYITSCKGEEYNAMSERSNEYSYEYRFVWE